MKFIVQKNHHSCGPVAVINYMRMMGIPLSMKKAYVGVKCSRKGTFSDDIAKFLRTYVTEVTNIKDLKKQIEVIPCILGYCYEKEQGHFVVVTKVTKNFIYVANHYDNKKNTYTETKKISFKTLSKFLKIDNIEVIK